MSKCTPLVTAVFLTCAVFAVADPAGAGSPFDHLQCHKVKDSIKFEGTTVDLSAIQVAFQLPADCTVKGKATEFCVPVRKTVTNPGDAPGSLIGPGQDLSDNDYVCYKIKCPAIEVADTTITDQFGERSLGKFQTSKLCVPAVKGVVTTTTSTTTTSTTTTTLAGMCIEDGDPTECNAYMLGGACATCCNLSGQCFMNCSNAAGSGCMNPMSNNACAQAMNNNGCADECCP